MTFTEATQAFLSVSDFPADNVAAALISGAQEVTLGDCDRVFPVASVTKLVVAYGVMVAVEEGAVELDQLAGPEGSMLRHLLAHASGVGFDTRVVEKPVGSRRIYSSAGYEWAAEIVGRATGIDFPEYLRQAVLEPLGMSATRLSGSAGHGLETSVHDLMSFAREVRRPRILHPSTVSEMRSVQFPGLRGIVPGYGSFKDCVWGLGFEIHGAKDHWMGVLPVDAVGHFGMSGTYMWWAGDAAMVMLSDRSFGDWAKPLWAETNSAVWSTLSDS